MTPTPGRIVHYRTSYGADLPAIITVTPDSYRPTENYLAPDSGAVHLTVFTPGGTAEIFNVHEDQTKDAHVPVGTWRWPAKS